MAGYRELTLIEKTREASYLDSVKLTKTSNMSDEMVTIMMRVVMIMIELLIYIFAI